MKKLATPTIADTHLRLRPDGSAELLPVTAGFWPDLVAGRLGDFRNEYLVSHHAFDADWTSWERHPRGDELVVLLHGKMDFVLDLPDGEALLELRRTGDFAFVPKGTWHTANALEPSALLFVTAGEGTENRPR